MRNNKTAFFDLHIHSKYSYDSLLSPRKIIQIAKRRNLNGIAITDHNTIRGGVEAQQINKDPDFIVIVGAEIKTDVGDVIGLFLNKEIQSQNFQEVIDEIHRQNGLAILAHPTRNHNFLTIDLTQLNGIEILNARSTFKQNLLAKAMLSNNNLRKFVGSDSHFKSEIGIAVMKYSNFDFENVRESILSHHVEVTFRKTKTYRIILSAIIKIFKTNSLHNAVRNLLSRLVLYSHNKLTRKEQIQ